MSLLTIAVWPRRLALAALTLGALATGAWTDLFLGRAPEILNIRALLISGLFAWLAAEVMLPLNVRFPADPLRLIPSMAALGALHSVVGHALPFALSGVLQVPVLGVGFLADVFDGLLFTVGQAALPALVCGALAGVLCALLLRERPLAV